MNSRRLLSIDYREDCATSEYRIPCRDSVITSLSLTSKTCYLLIKVSAIAFLLIREKGRKKREVDRIRSRFITNSRFPRPLRYHTNVRPLTRRDRNIGNRFFFIPSYSVEADRLVLYNTRILYVVWSRHARESITTSNGFQLFSADRCENDCARDSSAAKREARVIERSPLIFSPTITL